LGLVLHELLDYKVTVKAVAQWASRALGLLIAKRLCPFCEEQIVEDELHVVLKCHIHEDLRVPLIELAWEIEPDVENYSDDNVLYFHSCLGLDVMVRCRVV